jgi:nucleoside-diphosphate-sugar epimerase
MVKPRLLILGGAGYFGARLAQAFSSTHDLLVSYRSCPPLRQAWLKDQNFRAVHYDAATMSTLDTGNAVDIVVNLAMPGAREAMRNPDRAMAQAKTTAMLCQKMLDNGQASQLLHLSTFHVYGGKGGPGYSEETQTLPTHPYGITHLAVERMLQDHACANLAYILRATNMAGAPAHLDLGDQAGLIFLDLCRQAVQDNQITLGNDGASHRDMLPFNDAIAALRLLANKPKTHHRLFNLGAGYSQSLSNIAQTIAEECPGTPIHYGHGTDLFRSPFNIDISRLRALGWRPLGDLASEVSGTLEAFK